VQALPPVRSCLRRLSRALSFCFLDFKFKLLQALDMLEFPNAEIFL
jgi:hypothetical protein